MRELAIGDIHGCLAAFERLLAEIQLQPEDTLVLLGDYVDRGPDSCRVLDLILELARTCTVVPLLGNHEQMMLGARQDPLAEADWLRYGGDKTLVSYERAGFPPGIDGVPARHWALLEWQCFNYWEAEREIYVHAFLDPYLEMAEQPGFLLFWERFHQGTVHKSGKRIICGHASQKPGLPVVFEHGVCIDTYAHGGGWLTCFEPATNRFIQTRQQSGEVRRFEVGGFPE
jgi:serine/threonine protein phosphatase 1